MKTAYPAWLLRMAEVLERAGAPVWLVGGAVRNAVMGLPISDADVCGPTRPEEIVRLCAEGDVHAHLRAAHFGTVELHIAGEAGKRHMAEYTTFREDSYRCGHQPSEVRFTTDVSVDALRRDFSVNALYLRMAGGTAGEMLDPTGGLLHLQSGVLHTVTKDPDQVLRDDGLRILRAARFQAELGLVPTESLLLSAARHAPLIADIAPERLRDELHKILLADGRYPSLARKAPAVESGLHALHRMGAWPYLFQSLPYDAGAAGATSRVPIPAGIPAVSGRLALLFSKADADATCRQLEFLRFAARERDAAMACIEMLQRLRKGNVSVFQAVQIGAVYADYAKSALGALLEGGAAERATALCEALGRENLPLTLGALRVNGRDLLPLFAALGRPQKEMGALLLWLWEAAAEARVPNEREALLQAARERLLAK